MKNFIGVFVVAMVLGLSACGTPTTSQPNPEPMPPATNVPSGEAPVGVPPLNEAPVACTMDAKICPDGSAVGRTAPDCEFAPCPGE